MALIEELSSPYLLATGLLFEMILWHELRETAKLRAVAERFLELSREQRYVFFECLANVGHGWALSHEDGQLEESLTRMKAGLAMHSAIGTRLPHSYWMGYLGDVLLKAGRVEEGLEVVDEALELTKTQLDVYYDAESHRQRGDLLVRAGRQEEAEAAYLTSLEVARDTGARAFELRTATGLAGLYAGQGRSEEGRALLEPVLDGFAEDLDTPDLRDAREQLGRLA